MSSKGKDHNVLDPSWLPLPSQPILLSAPWSPQQLLGLSLGKSQGPARTFPQGKMEERHPVLREWGDACLDLQQKDITRNPAILDFYLCQDGYHLLYYL